MALDRTIELEPSIFDVIHRALDGGHIKVGGFNANFRGWGHPLEFDFTDSGWTLSSKGCVFNWQPGKVTFNPPIQVRGSVFGVGVTKTLISLEITDSEHLYGEIGGSPVDIVLQRAKP